MHSDRINAKLSKPLADFVSLMVGDDGLYETSSEYVRDLIRRNMEYKEERISQKAILEGYRDWQSGRSLLSTGDFQQDMLALDLKEGQNWA